MEYFINIFYILITVFKMYILKIIIKIFLENLP
jgi:hypothetical protein